MSILTVCAAVVGFTLTGCCSDDVRTVYVYLEPFTFYIWVGDTNTVQAVANRTPTLICPAEIYSTKSDPFRFRYSSSDTTVGKLSIQGTRIIFAARASGMTRLVAVTEGIASDSTAVMVSPAIGTLQVTLTPPTPRVGDTITVQVDALDSHGATVTGALLWVPTLLAPSDTLGTWLRPANVNPLAYAPVVSRLVAQHAGRLFIEAAAPHSGSGPSHRIADTVIVTVHDR